MTGGFRFILIALALGGCVPRGASVPPEAPPAPAPAPPLPLDFDAVTNEKPAWEMRPVKARAQTASDGRRFHRVEDGETGIAIARAYRVPWSRLIAENGLSDPFVIKAGQRIYLPAAAPGIETRAAAFRLNIDDILTGGAPAAKRPAAAPAHFAGRFDWPAAGHVAQRFGPAGAGRYSQGIDIAAPTAATIRAAADGTVAFVGDNVPGYGGLVLIRHGDGYITAYGHIASASVKRDQRVARGDAIGRLAAEADPALHFEVRHNRAPVDPAGYLPKR